MVSHEFRTALTGIQGYSELMSGQEVTPDEVKEFSGDINSDALRLNRMITEMLDLNRIESGRISLHLAPLDLNQLLQDAIGRAQVTTNKHRIVAGLDPSLSRVNGDGDRLTEVVSNLLNNAIKYSPGGGAIEVTTKTTGGEVQVSIKDHGQGIPPEFTNRIFGRYERFEGNGESQVVGTGLGLAIAQQIVQLHKGRIWVDSKLGEGSEFHFTIPARLENPAAESSQSAVARPANAA
jgi:signal transduction histidine kinase